MKVLVLTTSYAPQVGGIQTHVYQKCKAIRQQGIDVRVLLITDDTYSPKSDENDPPVIKRNLTSGKKSWDISSKSIFDSVMEEIRDFQPDIVHGHTFWMAYPLLPISLRSDYPSVVLTFHSSHFLRAYYSDSIKSMVKLRLGRWTPDIGIATSRELTEAAKDTVSAPVFRIPNGVDTDEFSPNSDISISDIEGIEIDEVPEFIVLTTRRFEPKNGMEYLVKSIPDTDEGVFFILLGDGSQRQELQRWIESRGLSHRVHMPGSVPNDSIKPYYQVADVSVLPSLKEAISISGLESMSCGTPVIGTDVGGIPELIDHGEDGQIVEPRSPNEIAEAIEHLRTHPKSLEQMAHNSRQKILGTYSWEAIGERTMEIYESVS